MRNGVYDQTLGWRSLSQPLKNRIGYTGAVVYGAGGTPKTSTGIMAPFTPRERWFYLYSGGSRVKSLHGVTFEYADTTTTVLAPFAQITGELDAPVPLTVPLRKAQYDWATGVTEKGNCEIAGVSAAGVPDYILDFTAGVPAYNVFGGGKTSAVNPLLSGTWNDKDKVFDVVRALGKVAVGSRVLLLGRFILRKDNTGIPPTGGMLQWQWIDNGAGSTLTDTVTPTSASDIVNDAPMLGQYTIPAYNNGIAYLQNDVVKYGGLNYKRNGTSLGTSGHLPTNTTYWTSYPSMSIPETLLPNWNVANSVNNNLPMILAQDFAGVTTVELGFTARMNVVHAEVFLGTYSWKGTHPGDRIYTTMGTRDQIDVTGAGAITKFSFEIGCADFQAQTITFTTAQMAAVLPPNPPGVVTCNVANNNPVDRGTILRNLDELRIGVLLTVEITGDDLNVF